MELEIAVEPGIAPLQQQLRALFPQEVIQVTASNEVLVLSGDVSSNAVALQVAEIAQASSSKSRVINLLRPPGEPTTQQVMLQVRFAEVDRRALTEAGRQPHRTVAGRRGPLHDATVRGAHHR